MRESQGGNNIGKVLVSIIALLFMPVYIKVMRMFLKTATHSYIACIISSNNGSKLSENVLINFFMRGTPASLCPIVMPLEGRYF